MIKLSCICFILSVCYIKLWFLNHEKQQIYWMPTINNLLQVGISTVPGIVTIDKDALEESYEILFNLDNPELEETICDSFRWADAAPCFATANFRNSAWYKIRFLVTILFNL